MTARNDITGDSIVSKSNSEEYRNNFANIFGKKEPQTLGEQIETWRENVPDTGRTEDPDRL